MNQVGKIEIFNWIDIENIEILYLDTDTIVFEIYWICFFIDKIFVSNFALEESPLISLGMVSKYQLYKQDFKNEALFNWGTLFENSESVEIFSESNLFATFIQQYEREFDCEINKFSDVINQPLTFLKSILCY